VTHQTQQFKGTPPGRVGFDAHLGLQMTDRKIIDSFTLASGYAFLSNFHPSTIWVEGKSYPTVEHAYQAHKTLNEESRELIRKAKDPAIAKKLGRGVEMTP